MVTVFYILIGLMWLAMAAGGVWYATSRGTSQPQSQQYQFDASRFSAAGGSMIIESPGVGQLRPKQKIPSCAEAYEATRTLKAFFNEHAPEDKALTEMLQKTAQLVVLAEEN